MHTKRTKEPRKVAARVNGPLPSGNDKAQPSPAPAKGPPDKFIYALSAFTAERRKDGWFVAKSVPSFADEKPKWSGPHETIETACLSIGRHLAVEIADRHTRSIEAHQIVRTDALYGLKATTRLRAS